MLLVLLQAVGLDRGLDRAVDLRRVMSEVVEGRLVRSPRGSRRRRGSIFPPPPPATVAISDLSLSLSEDWGRKSGGGNGAASLQVFKGRLAWVGRFFPRLALVQHSSPVTGTALFFYNLENYN
jgi:hypothetical protein